MFNMCIAQGYSTSNVNKLTTSVIYNFLIFFVIGCLIGLKVFQSGIKRAKLNYVFAHPFFKITKTQQCQDKII